MTPADNSPDDRHKRTLGVALRFTLSAVLIWWAFRLVDLDRLCILMAHLSWSLVAAAVLLVAAQTTLLGWRWHRIVVRLGGRLPAGKSIHWVYLGIFVSQVLPSSVGGDVVRIWNLHRLSTAKGVAFASVAIDRLTGLALTALLVAVLLPSVWSELAGSPLRFGLLAAGPVLVIALVLLAVGHNWLARLLPAALGGPVTAVGGNLRHLCSSNAAIAEVTVLGVVASLIIFYAAYVIALGLGITLSFTAITVLVGGAALLSVLPISLGGWGVRELGVITLLGLVGVDPERALALSVIWGFLPAMVSLPAGLFWWVGHTGEPTKGQLH